jgi:hypothetical protein
VAPRLSFKEALGLLAVSGLFFGIGFFKNRTISNDQLTINNEQ